MHLEAGLPNPVKGNYTLQSLLAGIKRDKGVSVKRKLAITPGVLLQIKATLYLASPTDAVFWAAALIAFFGLLRKSLLLPNTRDPAKLPTLRDLAAHPQGFTFKITYSKTIQYGERALELPLPAQRGNPLATLSSTRFSADLLILQHTRHLSSCYQTENPSRNLTL